MTRSATKDRGHLRHANVLRIRVPPEVRSAAERVIDNEQLRAALERLQRARGDHR